MFAELWFCTLLVGRTVGKIDNKANSVQLLLQLPTGTELGKIKLNKNSCDENIKITKCYDYSTNCKRKFLLAGKKCWLKKKLCEENYQRKKVWLEKMLAEKNDKKFSKNLKQFFVSQKLTPKNVGWKIFLWDFFWSKTCFGLT